MTIDEYRASIGLPPEIKTEALSRSAQALRSRLSLKRRAVEYLGGKCRVCGYRKCMSALEFHHIDPSTKVFEVGKFILKVWWKDEHLVWNQLIAELKKCALLCANCHRELEDGHIVLPT